jgi:hypothetical protein
LIKLGALTTVSHPTVGIHRLPAKLSPTILLASLSVAGCFVFQALQALAQEERPAPERSVFATPAAGAYTFGSGEWGVIGLGATNRTRDPAKLKAVVYYSDNRTLQFARELWVPPAARRKSWCLLKAPDGHSALTIELRTRADDLTQTPPQPLPSPEGGIWSNSSLPIDPAAPVTAVISDLPGGHVDGEVRQMVLAARRARNLQASVAGFYGDFLTPAPEALGAVRHVVVAGNRPADDSVARAALREWVRRGGKLWIMLDRVSPETVQLLLGDAVSIQKVDQVGLTTVEIHSVDPSGAIVAVDGPREYDDPVEMVRVFVTDAEILNTVNGWPAAFRVPLGQGSVLCTTLGPRGWLRLPDRGRRGDDPESEDPVAVEPMTILVSDFFREAAPDSPAPADMHPLLSEQVGYRILNRMWVISILGAFCLVIIGAGLWLAQRHMTEWLGWIGPAGAIAAAALLITLGLSSRRSVPPTVAVLEHASGDESAELSVQGAMAVYLPEPGPMSPPGVDGGILWPDMTGLDEKIRTLVWTDVGDCHWEDLTLPAGVRFAEIRRTLPLAAPLTARATLSPDGLSGALTGSLSAISDGVLIGSSGENMAVSFQDEGRFRAEAGDELAPARFIASDLLSDEQRRRQAIYEQKFPRTGAPPPEPRLAFWCESAKGVEAPEKVRFTGSMLVTVPLELERLQPGAQAVIPSPLSPYRGVRMPDQKHSSAFNNVSGRWAALQFPSDTWLRFQLPAAALPFEPQSAVLRIRIDAPGRPVEIRARTADGSVTLQTWRGPHGEFQKKIADPGLLQLDSEGGILLGIHVGADVLLAEAEALATARVGKEWMIESVALEVSGKAAPRP